MLSGTTERRKEKKKKKGRGEEGRKKSLLELSFTDKLEGANKPDLKAL